LTRLPWSQWHWIVVIGLGTVWILDGLEVTVVGNISGLISKPGSGIAISQGQVSGLGAAMYVAGACAGALFFGWLTDRFGRKKLFMITLGTYLAATALTAASFAPWWFFLFRFLTGLGIGGEYAAINSAIDELIPSKHRGVIDIVINGTYWAGAAVGALLTVPATNDLPADIGWRVCFGLGVVLGVVVLLVRCNVPESPRWTFVHGRDREAENLVDEIEERIELEKGTRLPEASGSIEIRQRQTVGFITIARTMFTVYPRRAVLGFSLFIGQAFLYNAITFGYAQILATFFGIKAFFYAIGTGAGGIAGPLLFSALVSTGQVSDTVVAFSVGAVLMIAAGVVEIFLGVRAERQGLEQIARPLSAAGAPASNDGSGQRRAQTAG
jgi:MFS family permease